LFEPVMPWLRHDIFAVEVGGLAMGVSYRSRCDRKL
jgi:hypothetical protein